MQREALDISSRAHWPSNAANAAALAAEAGRLDAAALRLSDRWYQHLAERRVATPREADFASFGSVSKLEDLRNVLSLIAPGDIGPLRLAMKAKRAANWRKAKEATGYPAPRPRGRAPKLSLPLDELPKSWQRALREMKSLRKTLDAGRLSLEDRTPPSAKVIRNLTSTLRIFGGVCLQHGVPIELTIENFTLWRAARRKEGNRDTTIASRCKELAMFAAWCEMDEALIREIHARRLRHQRASAGVRKRKEEWMLKADVGIGDVWVQAEELLDAAQAAPAASDLRATLTLDAACLALSIVAPLRIGDLHRIRIGEHLHRYTDGWSLSILTAKNELLYDRPRLWPEVTPFLDAVILLDAPGGEFWAGYDARCEPSTALFSGDAGRTGYDELWPTKVWIRHVGIGAHVVRSLWHQMMFESEDDEQYIALALCGQGHGRTAVHYIMQGNRRRAARRGRAKIRAARGAA